MKKILGFGGLLLFAAGAVAWGTGVFLADLRPDSVTLEPDDSAERRGREHLERMSVAMGVPSLLSHRTTRIAVQDAWHGMAAYMTPWPQAEQDLVLVADIASFDSHAVFESGVTWGVQEGKTWKETDGGMDVSDDANIGFILPTVQYFFHLAHRIRQAPIVRDAGPEDVKGVTYDRVYATWESVSANGTYDQYLVYLHPETSRLAKVQFTVRDAGSFITATAHYDELHEVDGYFVPGRLTIGSVPSDALPDAALHTFTLKTFEFDSEPVRRPL